MLRVLRDDPELLSFLRRHPLGRLEFSGRVPNRNWLGFYDARPRDVVVNSIRSAESYGKEFRPPGLASVSAAGKSLAEAMQRSLYHEIGHHILESLPAQAPDQIAAQGRSRQAFPNIDSGAREPTGVFLRNLCGLPFRGLARTKTQRGTIWSKRF